MIKKIKYDEKQGITMAQSFICKLQFPVYFMQIDSYGISQALHYQE